MARKVENKHILITGATSGLGYAMAEALLAEGAIASRSAEKLDRADAIQTFKTFKRFRIAYSAGAQRADIGNIRRCIADCVCI